MRNPFRHSASGHHAPGLLPLFGGCRVEEHDPASPVPGPRRPQSARTSRLTRYFILPLVIVLSVVTLGAADTQARYQDLGHKLMCICGCSEILIECNHVGCPDSDRMLAELRAAIDHGDSNNAILAAFQNKYGPTALAAPMLTKFNMVAWVVPPALLILGLFGTWILVKRWRMRVAAMPLVEEAEMSDDLREKIRKETEV
jgi:cytochrome c-type biogenesis protein CcmH/NrfF